MSPEVLNFLAKKKPSSVCLPFFMYLYNLFQNEFKEAIFYLQCHFIIFLYKFRSKITLLPERIFLHDQIHSKMMAFFHGER